MEQHPGAQEATGFFTREVAEKTEGHNSACNR